MSNFYNDFELEQVLGILKSSKYIENQLLANYKEETFQNREYSRFKKSRPLLVKELYLLILELKDLPTLQEFQQSYQEKHPVKEAKYFAEMTSLTKGYRSLVRDLHFYFLLKESGLFEEVKISYLFDLQAKTDILLREGQKLLGLQLFSGGKHMKAMKQQKAKKKPGQKNYELIYFGTQYKGDRKKIKTNSGVTFLLYSEQDVETVYALLRNSKTVESLIDEEQCEKFDDFDENIPVPKKSDCSTNLETLNAKHSILDIGKLTELQISTNKKWYEERGIAYYYCVQDQLNQDFRIVDGQGFEKYESLIENETQITFNLGQYKIEHALTNIDIAAMAGAGTGKTYTLVSRALYLLNMGVIKHVHEITMITFTNEAANNLLEGLKKRFLQMFKNTKDNRFLRYLDELNEMKIMTIPAFAKHILSEFGHQIGIGKNFKISQLISKRNEFIESSVHQIYADRNIQNNELKGIEFYQIIEFIKAFSEKIEQKGIFAETLIPHLNELNPFEQLVVNTLVCADKQLMSYKNERDVLSLSDLTRYLRLLLGDNIAMDSFGKKYKYLFVDEYQDTDILQIEFIAKLAIKTDVRLLVVGDIKQGIYRFRGANVTAFELLEEFLSKKGRKLYEKKLTKNYRTNETLLNSLEDIFYNWKKLEFLPKSDRLIPTKFNNIGKMNYYECHNDVSAEAVLQLFNDMKNRQALDNDEIRTMAILVRTNAKVTNVHNLLSEICMQHNIPLQIVKDGTLFKSRAAKDLLALLYSWLYPGDSIGLFELAQTAFCKPITLPKLQVTPHYNMNNIQFDLPTTWREAGKQFKLAPGLVVLNEFLQNTPYEKYLFTQTNCDQTVKQYVLNLHKITTQMTNGVQNNQVDLYSLYNWLKIEVSTNSRDDEAELNEADYNQDFIKVMTVHKSKGLEFDTVVIPYVNDQFLYSNARDCEIYVSLDNSEAQYSWKYKASKYFENETQYFNKMRENEIPHVIQEQTRNLYVALTRAKEQLVIFGAKNTIRDWQSKNPKSWLHLIKGGRNNEVTTCFNLCNCRSTI